MKLAVLLTLLVTAAAFGCRPERVASTTTTAATTTAPTTPASTAAAQTSTLPTHMAEHFSSSVALRNALIAGDLDAFHAAAASLSDREISANAWKPYLAAIRRAAKRARDANTIGDGAQALADVGRTCSECHVKLGGPKLVVGEPPPPGSGAKPHMARHHWAADRLWEGLMAPSQEAWTKGAEVFTDAPLEPEAVTSPRSVSPEIGELAKRAHAFGQDAHQATDVAARTQAVANVYATCAGCHTKLRVDLKRTQ